MKADDIIARMESAGEGYATTVVHGMENVLELVEDIGGSGMKRAMRDAIQGAAHAGYMKGYLDGRKEGRNEL